MPRKSKTTLQRERLAVISDCPYDIFNKIEATDDIFDKITLAEGADAKAIYELASMAFSRYSHIEENGSTIYFLKKGLEVNNAPSALLLIEYASINNVDPILVESAMKILSTSGIQPPEDKKNNALFKSAIFTIENGGDYGKLLHQLSKLRHDGAQYAEIYLSYKEKIATGKYDEDIVKNICEKLNAPNLASLPLFSGEYASPETTSNEQNEVLLRSLSVCNADAWQDFFIMCIYEHCTYNLGGDFRFFAESIAYALANRNHSKNRRLHTLAYLSYAIRHAESEEKQAELSNWYNDLQSERLFKADTQQIENEKEMLAVMKEAAYTSEYAERITNNIVPAPSNVLEHIKNRYVLNLTLENHMKRANKHVWETSIAIRNDFDSIPAFRNIKISERRHSITRGSIIIPPQKKLSQIICDGEVCTDVKVYPLILDIILDISYVSTTKCENVEIKTKSSSVSGNYTILTCNISIY